MTRPLPDLPGMLTRSTRMPAAGRAHRAAGFTLVEVMLAITLVALIMAMAYGGFRASVRATSSGEALIEQTNQLRVTHQFIRRQLTLAQALIIEEGDEPGMQVRFEGEDSRVRFVAPMPGYLSFGGSYVQQLSLERGRDGIDLVFYFAMLNGYEPGDIEAHDGIVLMEGLRSGSFIFLGEDEEEIEPFWADYWERTDQLPLAVGLTLDLDRDNGLVWPDLIAPVMLDTRAVGASQQLQPRRGAELIMPRQRRQNQ